MIIIRCMGGLGNQMFQYALGRRLALERKVPLKLDLSWFASQDKRKFELDKFNIQASIATDEEIFHTRYIFKNRYLRKGLLLYQQLLPYWQRRIIHDNDNGMSDLNILRVSSDCFLSGYWQSEKYFKSISDVLKTEFRLKEALPLEQHQLIQEIISNKNSTSVHVRRGDYVTENTGHLVLSKVYYLTAIEHIVNKLVAPNFYFFSDGIDWVKEHIRISYPASYIQPTGNDAVDMTLMRFCAHHINANSSFSWWSAWLGEKDDSIIVVPKNWFIETPFPEDRVPNRWIRF